MIIADPDYPYTSDTTRLTAPTEKLTPQYTIEELTAGLYYFTKPAPRQIPIALLFIVALLLIGIGAMLALRYGDGMAVLAAIGCGAFVWMAFGKQS